MKRFLLSVIALSCAFSYNSFAQSGSLNEAVPYQGDTLLINPISMSVTDANQAYMDCDWNTLMSMIRDLEERIAGAMEVDTVYNVYVSGQVVDQRIYMHYDCVVLRDSVLSLQIQLDEALLAPPTVLSQEVMSIAQRTASIKAKVTDDGGAAMRIWGVIYGKEDWWDDASGFFVVDSLLPDAVDFEDIADSLLADRLTEHRTAMNSWVAPAALPIHTAMDTSILNVDSVFVRQISGLDRYTNYIAIPVAANDSLMTEFNPTAENVAVNGAELYADYLGLYGIGDTLKFRTLPDPPSGLTLDTSNVTSSSALLKLSIADAGGQGPDEVTFYYDTLDFATNAAVIDSLTSDSTGGTEHSVLLTGLTRYTDYYFNAFAENLADDVGADANMVFKTAAELPSFDTVYFAATVDSLVATLSDDGGVAPTSQQFSIGSDALLTSSTDSAATLAGDTFKTLYAGTPGNTFYANASVTNPAGTVDSDTISWTTVVEVTSGPTVANLIASRATLQAAFDFGTAVPSTVGIKWGQQANLSDATDNDITLGADSTVQLSLTGLSAETDYYFTAYAENAGGTAYGDTLAFTTKVALTDANIHSAVNAWVADSTSAESTYGHISDWDVSLVTNISWLFTNKSNFNSDISGWDVSGVTEMNGTFMNTEDFNQPIGDWDVGAVTSMSNMFYNAVGFNQPLENWDVGGVANFREMFAFASTFNQDLNSWDVSSATEMERMFSYAKKFNGAVGDWETGMVQDMSYMFERCDSLNQFLNSWDVSAVTDMSFMFNKAVSFDQDLDNWDVSLVKNMNSMFRSAENFNGDISNWSVGNVTSMSSTFGGCASFNQPLNSWDMSNVIRTPQMFLGASAFNQPLDGWDVSAVTSMTDMFNEAVAFNQDLNSWDVSSVTSMEGLFRDCTAFNGDISTWTVSSVTTMASMFRGCGVFDGNISNWNVGAVSDMGSMFRDCTGFNQNLGPWDVSQVTNMRRMFYESSSFNQDLSLWNVSAVEDMEQMFALSSSFNQDLSSWNISSVTTMAEFGAEASFSTAHYDAMLVAWSQLQLQSNVNFEINADWCYGDAARQDLIDAYNWSISDGNRCDPAPEGYTDPATNVALTSSDLEGRFENMGTVSDAGFIVSTDETLAGAANQSAGTTSPFTLSLTGLTSSTRYYFQAYATDELGTVYGDVRNFLTQGLPIVSTIADTTFTDTTATLIGLSDGDVTPAATATGFKWGALSDLSDATDVAGDALTDTFTYALTASGPLYYAAYATNSLGTTYGDTIQLVGDAAVSTAAATDLSTTSAQLNATLTTGRKALTATGFAWGYQEDLSDATTIAGDVLTGDFSADLTGLDHEAKIYFSAFFTDDSGTTHGDTLSQCLKACESFEYDGYTYETVLIDCQCWFAENLRSAQYSDGSSIPGGLSNSEWENTQSGAQAIYEADSTTYFDGYGRLYNHGAVVDSRGLCPNGWDEPTSDDFDALTSYLGGTTVAGGFLKAAPTDTPGWDGAGSSVGWSALPGGKRSYDGFYSDFDDRGYWWSSSFDDLSLPVVFGLVDLSDGVDQIGGDWRNGYSIRCLRGAPSAPVSSTSEASNFTNTTATLNGSVAFNGWKDVTATGFKWGYAADLSDATDASGNTLQDDFSADLTGLVTYDSLYYVAYVANDLGTAYGDTMVFEVKLRPCFGNTSYTYNGDDYDLVEIGEQCWFVENLLTTAYSNGDAIEESQLFDSEWETTSEGRYSDTWDETEPNTWDNYGEWYGYLYNWHAVNDPRGLCPTGWSVPDTADFTQLATFLGGMSVAGEKMKAGLSVYSPLSWDGTNESGWSGLPAGWRNLDGSFEWLGINGGWWTTTPTLDGLGAYWRELKSSNNAQVEGVVNNKQNGFSVRCLIDEPSAPVVSTDEATPVSDTEVTLVGTAVFNWEAITATGFKWGYAADLSDGVEVVGDTLAGEFTADLTGLVTDNTLYYVSYATNALGTTYGDTLSVLVKLEPCQGLTTVSYDGYDYDLVEIGAQCWFAENLRNDNYADGSTIPLQQNLTSWAAATSGLWCEYQNDFGNGLDFGYLYNWYAVNDSRGICPSGWHVPTDDEFTALVDVLGFGAGEQMKSSASDVPSWDGTNTSGWSGLPGSRRSNSGGFGAPGSGYWWSSTASDELPDRAGYLTLSSGSGLVGQSHQLHESGFSVRCLKD